MAGENVPIRPIAKNAVLYVAIAPAPVLSVYTPTAIATVAATGNIHGACVDIGIRGPLMQEIDQTAGGDQGHMVIHGRKMPWTITIGAFMDIANPSVFGDFRVDTLLGQYVEFVITNDVGFYICRGIGRWDLE